MAYKYKLLPYVSVTSWVDEIFGILYSYGINYMYVFIYRYMLVKFGYAQLNCTAMRTVLQKK